MFDRSPALVAIVLCCVAAATTSSSATSADRKLLVVSFDAFKPAYLELGITPNLQAVIDNGVRSAFMRSTFPTKTLPNHFSMATGLHAGVHGVCGSTVQDVRHNRTLKYGYELFHQHDWVLPIWTVNQQLGGHSGSMMWPGGEFAYANVSSTYATAYNHTALPKLKVDTVMQWLTDAQQPANLVLLYFDEPDFMGHVYSPQSNETLDMIRRADRTVGYIQQQLAAHNLTATTNIVYVSDHGMNSVASPQFINLSALLPPNSVQMYGGSPVVQIVPRTAALHEVVLARLRLGARRSAGRYAIYTSDELPKRWALRNAERVGPIVAVAAEGWAFEDMFETVAFYEREYNVTRSPSRRYGIHGYDNTDAEMRAMFVASGPDLWHGDGPVLDGFDNVELFGLFWLMLGYPVPKMPPTNGTGLRLWDAVLRRVAVKRFSDGLEADNPHIDQFFVAGTWHMSDIAVVLVLAMLCGALVHLLKLAVCAKRRHMDQRKPLTDKAVLLL